MHRPKRLTTVVMMLIIWAGVAGALFAAIRSDLQLRQSLKSRVQTIAATLPAHDVQELNGNESDLKTDNYRQLRDDLQHIRSNNQDLRFVYIMGRDGDKVFFYVDSETPNTPDYSPPGQEYPEPSDILLSTFESDEPSIEGPYRDDWGAWVSAIAPIVDPKTGQPVAVVGIDTPAASFYLQVLINASIPILLAAIPLAGLIRDRKLESKELEITGLKNQFVSIASHELRSPITGMLWAIQTLLKREEELTNQQKSLLTDMYHSTESSLATVNEILDLSVFERGQAVKPQREAVDMIMVLKEVSKTLKLGAEEKSIKIVLKGEWPQNAFVSGDVAALKRSFMNLISNAIKYSPSDSKVELHYDYRALSHVISIRDHGIGIPKKEQLKVMGGYYRASNAVRLQSNGTGLGLWITRLVIEQHGGKVELSSVVDKGTTITITLPAFHQIIAKQPQEPSA